MEVLAGAGGFTPVEGEPNHFVEQLRVTDLSLGTYSIPAGGVDDQSPHAEDEIYVVTRGRADLRTPSRTVGVAPGSVVYIPAGEEHRFTDVSEDLALLVFFAPPFRTRAAAPEPGSQA